MKHTDAEIEEAARRFEALADDLDLETANVEELADLRAIAEATDQTRQDEACLPNASRSAHTRGEAGTR